MLMGCRAYRCYLLTFGLSIRLSHSFSYPPDIECPKNLVAHGRLCCSYVRCDPGYQVKTCPTNFTADTCEVCPPGTMSYDPTDSNFLYHCDNIRDECPIDTIPVSFLATDKDPQACSKRCQCNTTANYCGTDPCNCRPNHCKKHYHLRQDCGCSPTRGETRSVDVTVTTADDKPANSKPITSEDGNLANQTKFLTSTRSGIEFSQTETTLKAQTARTQQPPAMYNKQDDRFLVAFLVLLGVFVVLVIPGLIAVVCRIKRRKVINNDNGKKIIKIRRADVVQIGDGSTQNNNMTPLLSPEQDATSEC